MYYILAVVKFVLPKKEIHSFGKQDTQHTTLFLTPNRDQLESHVRRIPGLQPCHPTLRPSCFQQMSICKKTEWTKWDAV